MKLNDYDDNSNKKMGYGAAVLAALLILSVITIVLVANKDYLKRRFGSASAVSESVSSVSSDSSASSAYSVTSEVFVSDLSFYKDYEARTSDSTSDSTTTESASSTSTSQEPPLTEATDGKHTLITNLDGSLEWAVISPHIPKCEYDFTNLFNTAGRLKYFEDNKCTSFFGIDVSKDQNYIDYNKVKKDGVSFVMVRLGSRGYQTGQLSVDDYFRDNVNLFYIPGCYGG